MARYLEYDEISGRIVSEIVSAMAPEPAAGCGIFEIPEDLQVDVALYAVRDGQLVKLFETNAERLERERVRRENHERVSKRMKAIRNEFIHELILENYDKADDLRKEYRDLNKYYNAKL